MDPQRLTEVKVVNTNVLFCGGVGEQLGLPEGSAKHLLYSEAINDTHSKKKSETI